MNIAARPVVVLSLFVLASCSPKPAQNCAVPWPWFYSWHDESIRGSEGFSVEPLPANIIKVTRTGRVLWNGIDVTERGYEAVTDDYLDQLARSVPQTKVSLDFDAGAPCSKIIRIRQMMMRHLRCDEQQICLQGPRPIEEDQS
ncbi:MULTISPECIES: hypothetical protein [unclassified Sphingobium]|uniref:hypothetical protein n=1 Tax=unclassified Sphingobium TaxID=2611147 RepID=UPI0022257CDA|nr:MULTISPECIES: hypothetical protein [unclassified Sphingobium]MCW2412029.1 hypothetical protein [Sphingobium sp. B8D3D]MCW2415673.1 hypothetical protein [Sphingobium sp. B8D3A]